MASSAPVTGPVGPPSRTILILLGLNLVLIAALAAAVAWRVFQLVAAQRPRRRRPAAPALRGLVRHRRRRPGDHRRPRLRRPGHPRASTAGSPRGSTPWSRTRRRSPGPTSRLADQLAQRPHRRHGPRPRTTPRRRAEAERRWPFQQFPASCRPRTTASRPPTSDRSRGPRAGAGRAWRRAALPARPPPSIPGPPTRRRGGGTAVRVHRPVPRALSAARRSTTPTSTWCGRSSRASSPICATPRPRSRPTTDTAPTARGSRRLRARAICETVLLVLLGAVWVGMARGQQHLRADRPAGAGGRPGRGRRSDRRASTIDHGPEEIADLSRAFNRMTGDLQAQQNGAAHRRRGGRVPPAVHRDRAVRRQRRRHRPRPRRSHLGGQPPGAEPAGPARGRRPRPAAQRAGARIAGRGRARRGHAGGDVEEEIDVARGGETRRLRVRAAATPTAAWC